MPRSHWPDADPGLNLQGQAADHPWVRHIARLMAVVVLGWLVPGELEARKNPYLKRPPNKPPIYKKFNNKKKKQMKVG